MNILTETVFVLPRLIVRISIAVRIAAILHIGRRIEATIKSGLLIGRAQIRGRRRSGYGRRKQSRLTETGETARILSLQMHAYVGRIVKIVQIIRIIVRLTLTTIVVVVVIVVVLLSILLLLIHEF